jgi:microcystin-dependent protein
MSSPYIGEIRMFAGNFAPNGWMFCEGQTLPIAENDALFTLIGTTYGGDGQETFNLPNLASRMPMHMGTGPDGTTYQIGEMAGTEQETLTTQQIPNHTHAHQASTNQASPVYTNATGVLGSTGASKIYTALDPANLKTMHASTSGTSVTGGSQPHNNMSPFLSINFIISLFGIFPSPN